MLMKNLSRIAVDVHQCMRRFVKGSDVAFSHNVCVFRFFWFARYLDRYFLANTIAEIDYRYD